MKILRTFAAVMAKKKLSEKAVSYKDLCKAIERKDVAPLYLLTGEEPYYIDEICKRFESFLTEEERDFNLNLFYGKDMNPEQVLAAARQYPMFSQWRVVIVKEVQIADERNLKKLLPYLETPNQNSILVICNKSSKISSAIVKAVNEKGIVFESPTMYENQVPKWIDGYFTEINLKAEAGVSQMIADLLGTNLQKITNEISKLAINLNKPVITTADVKTHIGLSKDYNIFELKDALAFRDITKANRIVNHFIGNPKENPLQKMLPILFKFFVEVIMVSQLPDKTDASIARAIGISPFKTQPYRSACGIYPLNKLFFVIACLRDADNKSKGVGVSPLSTEGDLLRELVFKILY
ncbi:MAG: DNA polymerase III subunit delta [Bacteroidales bacterium]|jgi:DNA polymerase-3 subunit delta|nr:DNA polymerase III subunit delta [Bacteroidales bacterium]